MTKHIEHKPPQNRLRFTENLLGMKNSSQNEEAWRSITEKKYDSYFHRLSEMNKNCEAILANM